VIVGQDIGNRMACSVAAGSLSEVAQAEDVGVSGGAAPAEEAAMHIIEDEE
jgi:Family of unknown function (DUF5709)